MATDPESSRSSPTRRRALASVALVVSGTAAAALAGLVAEDFLPAEGAWAAWDPRWLRMILLVAAVAGAAWAAWSLGAQRRGRGTLYYLRLQNETNEDYHRSAVRQAEQEYLAFRSLSAWCDPGGGTVDVRESVASMSAELQRSINDDADDSGFDVAPNLVFPAALALGYDWIPPRNVRLREFNAPRPGKNIAAFEWSLACADASGRGCAESGEAGHRAHFVADQPGTRALVAHSEPAAARAVRTVWLEYWLSDSDYSATGRPMESPHKSSADVVRTVGVGPVPSSNILDELHLLTYGRSPDAATGLSVLQVAEGAAYWLAQTLRDYPKATVFVAGAMPKTVAFALGYLMTSPPMRGDAGHPWQRIVPMGHFLGESAPQLRPTWVRADQADPDDLIARLST